LKPIEYRTRSEKFRKDLKLALILFNNCLKSLRQKGVQFKRTTFLSSNVEQLNSNEMNSVTNSESESQSSVDTNSVEIVENITQSLQTLKRVSEMETESGFENKRLKDNPDINESSDAINKSNSSFDSGRHLYEDSIEILSESCEHFSSSVLSESLNYLII
jgi:hypothetical protein